jgi:Matrixin
LGIWTVAQAQPGKLKGNVSTSTGPTSPLPSVNGVHLSDDGQPRRPGDPQLYDPGEEDLKGALVRWNERCFPLKVWISDGRHLQDVSWETIKQDRVPRVMSMLQNDPRGFGQLPEVDGWRNEFAEAAADGFERWRDMEKLGVVRYGFVDYPEQADIMVFFTNQFVGADGPGGTTVRGQTYGMDFTPQQVTDKLKLGQKTVPVVIELRVPQVIVRHDQNAADVPVDEVALERLRGDAAHEFGHALGIKKHSEDFHDLMYVNRMVPAPSEADKNTLKWLYSRVPNYWHYSATVSNSN